MPHKEKSNNYSFSSNAGKTVWNFKQQNKKCFLIPKFLHNSTLFWEFKPSQRGAAKPQTSCPLLQPREAPSVPSNEDLSPLPDWSSKGKVWLIYFREVRGSHEAVHSGWPEGLAGTVHSWGWAVSEVSCLSGGGYGRDRIERRLDAGDGVAGGGGAKPSPASGMREEHQLYYLLLCSE